MVRISITIEALYLLATFHLILKSTGNAQVSINNYNNLNTILSLPHFNITVARSNYQYNFGIIQLMGASGILGLICIGIALIMTCMFVAMKSKRRPAYMNASLGLAVTAGKLKPNPIKYTTVHKCTSLLY